MRGAHRIVVALCAAALGTSVACVPDEDKEPKWRKPPQAWNPKGDDLTFGTKNLEAFNTMSSSEKDAHIEALKGKKGSFKGQANFQRLTELGEKMDDSALGKYEVYATLVDPVLYEITVDYHLFANEQIGYGLPTGTYVEFAGTLADLAFKDDTKPRKLELKVKDVTLTRLED